jgi:hypothetical protein
MVTDSGQKTFSSDELSKYGPSIEAKGKHKHIARNAAEREREREKTLRG